MLATIPACSGETGTLEVTLTTAPGSTLLDAAQTLRMTITNPLQVVTAERTSSGFEIAIELDASGEAAALRVEALDASGALIANGASPYFPTGALSGHIVIYMAPPLSVGAAPLSLAPARSELAVGLLPYGAILAGGRLDSGAPSDAITIYNAYDHSLAAGRPLPAPRASMTLVMGLGGIAYLFGGLDEAGATAANLWRFDTTTPPSGSLADFGIKEGFARAGEVAVPIGNERFLITGSPIAELHGLDGSITARDDAPALAPAGVTVVANDGITTALFAGPDGVVKFRTGTFSALSIPAAARADASVIALPGGKVGVLCGSTDAVRIDATSGAAEVFAGVPSVAKTGCAAAATTRHMIIAGGTAAGGVDATVDIFDATTLARITSVPLVVPRTDAIAIALPNDQILIAGGVDAAGAPVGTLELFTPPVE
jgi:hypothetical protein